MMRLNNLDVPEAPKIESEKSPKNQSEHKKTVFARRKNKAWLGPPNQSLAWSPTRGPQRGKQFASRGELGTSPPPSMASYVTIPIVTTYGVRMHV